jgi:SRSO17 transposase
MASYITGLLLDGERKSVQPMAARLVDDECEIEAMRQRLQQAVCFSPWSDADIFSRVAQKVDREMPGVERPRLRRRHGVSRRTDGAQTRACSSTATS